MPGQTGETEQQYRLEIQSLVMRQAFAELDDAAESAAPPRVGCLEAHGSSICFTRQPQNP